MWLWARISAQQNKPDLFKQATCRLWVQSWNTKKSEGERTVNRDYVKAQR